MSNNNLNFSQPMFISSRHASLPGHFPDNPIVPGVVILDQVMRLWQRQSQHSIRQIINSKFIHILRADTPCTIKYDAVQKNNKLTQKINFIIADKAGNIIAKGLFSYD